MLEVLAVGSPFLPGFLFPLFLAGKSISSMRSPAQAAKSGGVGAAWTGQAQYFLGHLGSPPPLQLSVFLLCWSLGLPHNLLWPSRLEAESPPPVSLL